MEGLYHNTSMYPTSTSTPSSSSYMIQHSDHTSYYSPPPTLPYRSMVTQSAFSDARPYNNGSATSSSSSPHSDSISLVSHRNNSITSLPHTTSSMIGWSSPSGFSWPNNHHYSQASRPTPPYSSSTSCYSLSPHAPIQRPKLTTTVWEDEGTVCYQVDAKSVCVARRQDNDMINGTKLLNVVGMSRGKRDGILKNEKGRVVVKVGAMHLKGVWITFERAKDLASKFKITEILYPLFTDDPSVFLCPS
ncbi:transcription regulator HTH, apses-type DNA-binding domain-containing protein, partial [Chlamydoabsidia padenii]